MNIEETIRAKGIELPPAPKPVGSYVPAVVAGNMAYTSGQVPWAGGKLLFTGKVGHGATDGLDNLAPRPHLTIEQAQQCARQCCLNALAALKTVIGELGRVRRIVRVNVFVNSAAGFTDQAKVANGASELLVEILGEAGKHTRCAVGVAELPLDAPVELDLIAEIAAP
jgi:enamine deaminase RidA (YjgF/YER057c/UK114 family)